MFVFVFLAFASAHESHHSAPSALEAKFADCKFKRNDILECIKEFGGASKHGLCPEQVQSLKDNVFIGGSLISWAYPTKRVMDDCDNDRDGYISDADFYASWESCVVDCFTVALLEFALCEPGRKKQYKPENVTCFEFFHKNGELKE